MIASPVADAAASVFFAACFVASAVFSPACLVASTALPAWLFAAAASTTISLRTSVTPLTVASFAARAFSPAVRTVALQRHDALVHFHVDGTSGNRHVLLEAGGDPRHERAVVDFCGGRRGRLLPGRRSVRRTGDEERRRRDPTRTSA